MANKKWTLVIYTANDDNAKSYSKVTGAQIISAGSVDTARAAARKIVEGKGYAVRTLSVTTCGKIIAYTGRRGQAASIGGWRHKKPPTSAPKI